MGLGPALPSWASVQSTALQQGKTQRQISHKASLACLNFRVPENTGRCRVKQGCYQEEFWLVNCLQWSQKKGIWISKSLVFCCDFFTHSKWTFTSMPNFLIHIIFLKEGPPNFISFVPHKTWLCPEEDPCPSSTSRNCDFIDPGQ